MVYIEMGYREVKYKTYLLKIVEEVAKILIKRLSQ